jgi:uncharacterized membrane protein required for colicin V production
MHIPVNMFDLLLVTVLIGGLVRGRRHGLSLEFLSLLKWLTLLFACAELYQPLGQIVAESGIFDLLSSYIIAYLGVALLIFLMFSVVERRLTPRIAGSDLFGRGEYVLGMGSGLVRFACILLMALSLLNARAFSAGELQKIEKYQLDNYGSNLFPTLHSCQVAVFEKSLSGSFIRQDLSFLLISPTESNRKPIRPTSNL